jgi:signal transduction histidine kinase
VIPWFAIGVYILIPTQFIGIINSFNAPFSIDVQTWSTIGYAFGLVGKAFILYGFIILISKETLEAEEVAERLDVILGKTFHEIHIPLKAMNLDLTTLLESDRHTVPVSSKARVYVERVENAYNRIIAIITASMKMYESRRDHSDEELYQIPVDTQLAPISINTLVEIAILNVKSVTKDNVEFVCDYGGRTSVLCNASEGVQIMINLFKNAFDAFPQGVGKVHIRTRNRYKRADGTEEKVVSVSVRDSGPGVPAAIRGHIFKEGFSTKASTGRGYGLSIVEEKARSNGGTVMLMETTPEDESLGLSGAHFVLLLPRSDLFSFASDTQGYNSQSSDPQ